MKIRIFCIISLILAVMSACTSRPSIPETFTSEDRTPKIYPDYKEVTVPCNIAPLNFYVDENKDNSVARFTIDGKEFTYGNGNKILITKMSGKKCSMHQKGKALK